MVSARTFGLPPMALGREHPMSDKCQALLSCPFFLVREADPRPERIASFFHTTLSPAVVLKAISLDHIRQFRFFRLFIRINKQIKNKYIYIYICIAVLVVYSFLKIFSGGAFESDACAVGFARLFSAQPCCNLSYADSCFFNVHIVGRNTPVCKL